MKTYIWTPSGLIMTTIKVIVFVGVLTSIVSFGIGVLVVNKVSYFARSVWEELRPEKEGDNY